ncbi:MAG: hypothetical protein EOP58_09375, partial [Sphingomonadales bacterium]
VDDGVLSQAELDYFVEAAIERWIAAGATAEQVAAMRAATFDVADMAGIYLGTSTGNHISLDSDGAGFGWFLDATPGDDAEFTGTGTRLSGTGDAAGRMDLLTTIMHELGHQVGIGDTYVSGNADDLMYGYASVGERRLPSSVNVADSDGGPVGGTAFALAPVAVGTLPAGTTVQINYVATVNPYGPGVISPFSNTTTVTGTNFTAVTTVHGLVVDTLSVGGQIFVDADGDNVFDVGEGVSGVTLNLYVDLDSSGALEGAELTTIIASITTGANGVYSFSSLGAGNYVVEVAASNFAAAGPLDGRSSLNSVVDPDDDVDGDDNGIVYVGGAFRSDLITLDFNTETTVDGTNQLDINNTLDFGFATANQAPTSANLSGDSVTYTEDGAAVLLDLGGDATIADADNANFADGTLTVAITGNLAASEDVLRIATTAIVTSTSNTVSVNGTLIATYAGGSGGSPLIFVLNSAATPALVSELVRAINYTNVNGASPSTDARTVTWTLVDGRGTNEGAGNDTLTFTTDITVVRQNDAPVVPDSPDIDATEQVAVTVNPTLAVSDPDLDARNGGAGDYAGATFSINRDSGLDTDDQFDIDTVGAPFTISGSDIQVGGLTFATFSSGGGSLSISFTSTDFPATTALVNALLSRIQYTNLSNTPPASVQLDYGLYDGAPGGDQGAVVGGNDYDYGSVMVTITAVNDPVGLTAADTSVAGTEDTDLVFSSVNGNAITVSDEDDDTLTLTLSVANGTLTLSQTTGLTVTGDGTGSVELTGTAAYINSALEGLIYRGNLNFDGADSLSAEVSDPSGTTASETIAITLADDGEINGGPGDDTLSGTAGADLFMAQQGGSDTLTGLGGNDGFYMGGALDAGDNIDGGDGIDQVGLQGNYGTFGLGATPFQFGAGNLTNVEQLVLLSGSDSRFGDTSGSLYSYNLQMLDGNVGA